MISRKKVLRLCLGKSAGKPKIKSEEYKRLVNTNKFENEIKILQSNTMLAKCLKNATSF